MKKFVKNFLIFIIPVFLFFVFYICIFIYSQQRKVLDFLRCNPETRYVILGDSHVGFSVSFADKFHTKVLWQEGCHPMFSMLKLLEMERLGLLKGIKFCLLEMNYQTESSMTEDSIRFRFMSNLIYCWRYLPGIPTVWGVLDDCLKIENLNYSLNSSAEGKRRQLTAYSANEISRQKQAVQTHFTYLGQEHYVIKNYRENIEESILEFQRICSRNHIQFIVFSAPLSSIYRQMIPEKIQQVKISWLHFFAEHKIPYLDLSSSMPDEDFVELHHVLPTQKDKFTTILLREVESLKLVK